MQAILTLLVVAMLSGCRSLYAVAQFGRDRPELATALGFTRDRTLCCSALHYFLKALDGEAFEAVVAHWLDVGGEGAVSLDGKTVAGSGDGELPALHLISAYAAEAQAVLRNAPPGWRGPVQWWYRGPAVGGPGRGLVSRAMRFPDDRTKRIHTAHRDSDDGPSDDGPDARLGHDGGAGRLRRGRW